MENMYDILARLDQVDRQALNESQALGEKITKDMTAGEVISDFVASDDPRFQGKSREERRKMALGAYYGMHPEKSRREDVEEARNPQELDYQEGPEDDAEYRAHHGLDDPVRRDDRSRLARDVETLDRLEREALARAAQVDEADLDEVSRGEYIRQQDAQAERQGKKSFQAFGQDFNTDEVRESLTLEAAAKKATTPWPGSAEYKEKFGQDRETFRKKHAPSVMKSPEARKELEKLDTEYEAGKKGYGRDEEGDDDEEGKKKAPPTGEKRGRGRPKGSKRAIGAKGPSGKSKLLTREDYDRDEYDEEGEMAKSFLRTIEDAAEELQSILSDEENLPEWVQKKITLAYDYLDTARDYMKANPPEAQDEIVPEGSTGDYSAKKARAGKDIGKPGKQFAKIAKSAGERYGSKERGEKVAGAVLANLRKGTKESTGEEDTKAERAGRKVTKDIEYDEKVKDKIHGARRGSEDDKAERAGKKVTKDIEYDEKVSETTVSGSVATAPAAGSKKSKGGVEFGKGIYEGQLEESFQARLQAELGHSQPITESVNVTMTVSATDDEAMALSQLMKMAGLFRSEGYRSACGSCGQMHEGSCRMMEEDLANSADNTETMSTDYMVNDLAGGLNGPKQQVNPNNMADNPLAMKDLGKAPSAQINLGAIAEDVEQADQQRLLDLYRKIS